VVIQISHNRADNQEIKIDRNKVGSQEIKTDLKVVEITDRLQNKVYCFYG
jgi:hypothetical protein